MGINIGKYQFEGPYRNTASLSDQSGVYAILDFWNGSYRIIDVGESNKVKTRVETHDRMLCWNGSKKGALMASALYTPSAQQAGRMAIEQELRQQYKPPCGDR